MIAKTGQGRQHGQIAGQNHHASEVLSDEGACEDSEYPEPPALGTAFAPDSYYLIAAAMRACIPAMEDPVSPEPAPLPNPESSASEMAKESAPFTHTNIDPALRAELLAVTLPPMHPPFFSTDAPRLAQSDDPISILTGFAPPSNSNSLYQQAQSGSSSLNSSVLNSPVRFASYDTSDPPASSCSASSTGYTPHCYTNPPGEFLSVTNFSSTYTTPLTYGRGHNTPSATPIGFLSIMDFSSTATTPHNSDTGLSTSSDTIAVSEPAVPAKRRRSRRPRHSTSTASTSTLPSSASDPNTPSAPMASILASLHASIPAPPSIPEPHRSQQLYFVNNKSRVSRTRNADPRCLRCRRRHWSVSVSFPIPQLPGMNGS